MTIVITYETLFDLLRKEKSRDELQALAPEFLEEVRRFIDRRESDAAAAGVGARQRIVIEAENARKILRELYERRERKILTLALTRARSESAVIDSSLLLPEERHLFDELVRALKDGRTLMLGAAGVHALEQYPSSSTKYPTSSHAASSSVSSSPSLESSAPEQSPARSSPVAAGEVRVRFVAPVQKFLGKDLKVFGPFSSGDEAALPQQIVDILVRKKKAEPL